jgi:hypothetical protein
MSTFALIFTCFAGMFAFGFLFAGYAALLSLDMTEIDDFNRRLSQIPSRGFFAAVHRYCWMRREVLPLRRIVTHWRTRPDAWRAIWLGLAFLISAAISVQFASLPR